MYTFVIFIVFGLIPIVLTQSSCPDVKPVQNFNITAFISKNWYQIARYNDDFEDTDDCTMMTFKEINGIILFNVQSTLNNHIHSFGGSIDSKDNKNGIMYYHSKAFGGESDNTIPAIVLSVDYNSYTVLYICMYDAVQKKRTDMAWILSTTKTLSPAAKTVIEDLFHSSKILDKSKFFWEKFSNASCKENV